MTEVERGRDRDINSGRHTEKDKSRRHEGVHKTELPQAPIASQRFLAVLTS